MVRVAGKAAKVLGPVEATEEETDWMDMEAALPTDEARVGAQGGGQPRDGGREVLHVASDDAVEAPHAEGIQNLRDDSSVAGDGLPVQSSGTGSPRRGMHSPVVCEGSRREQARQVRALQGVSDEALVHSGGPGVKGVGSAESSSLRAGSSGVVRGSPGQQAQGQGRSEASGKRVVARPPDHAHPRAGAVDADSPECGGSDLRDVSDSQGAQAGSGCLDPEVRGVRGVVRGALKAGRQLGDGSYEEARVWRSVHRRLPKVTTIVRSPPLGGQRTRVTTALGTEISKDQASVGCRREILQGCGLQSFKDEVLFERPSNVWRRKPIARVRCTVDGNVFLD